MEKGSTGLQYQIPRVEKRWGGRLVHRFGRKYYNSDTLSREMYINVIAE